MQKPGKSAKTIFYLMNQAMRHNMKVFSSGFEGIKERKQTIEIRLYDKKRRLINIGDEIEFTLLPDGVETIRLEVIGVFVYPSFKQLFENINLEDWNAKDWEIDKCIDSIRKIYSEKEENIYGVIGIKMRLI